MTGPHQGQPVYHAGKPLEDATGVVIAIHGRGASPQDIISLAAAFQQPDRAYFAPQAAGRAWYPNSFLAPIDSNEPYLSSALEFVDTLVTEIKAKGITDDKIMFMGFSQGACLASEYVARNAKRYAALAVLSGGVIGPEGTPRDYEGSLDGMPIFIGCSDVDFHIPVGRVRETTEIMKKLGADVDERIYPGMGHTVNDDEINAVKAMMESIGA
ncbi:MAG: dienelactone hydrolase family protein [Chloroflexota bacterium]